MGHLPRLSLFFLCVGSCELVFNGFGSSLGVVYNGSLDRLWRQYPLLTGQPEVVEHRLSDLDVQSYGQY